MDENLKKKKVRKVAVIFLVVLLILTFCSNTIMNYSLPQVATKSATSEKVSSKVRGSGVVEANSAYEVKPSGARQIKSVEIKAGDEVSKGDVLFTFEEGENSELTEAEDMLESLELEYAKALLKSVPDYAIDNLEIKTAKEDLEAAMEALKTAQANAKKIKSVKKQVADTKTKVEEQQKQVDSLQTKVDAYGDVGSTDEINAQITALERELTTLQNELSDLNTDLSNANSGGNADAVTELTRRIRDKELEIKNKKLDIDAAKANLNAVKNASTGLSSLKTSLAEANKTLSNLQTTYDDLKAQLAELEAAPTVKDAKAAVKEKQNTLTTMLYNLADKKEQDGLAAKSESMDLQQMKDKIEKQKEVVEKIKGSDDTKEIKAIKDGIVSDVGCAIGDSVTAESILANIQLIENGFTVSFSITNDQAKLLKEGIDATVENVWDDDISAQLDEIKVDPDKPNQNKIVVFTINGNVEVGQTLSLAAGDKSNMYDTVVPNSAVREDSNGKFVFVVTSKGTPLGNRYSLKRVEIEVLASDDSYSGVSGDIMAGDNVVTTSTKPLEAKMQVRLAE